MAYTFRDLWERFIWPERRGVNLEDPKQTINGIALDQLLGGGTSYTGRTVSFENSLTLSAYYRALSIKSGVLSALPFKLYRKTSTGREEVTNHPLSKLFSRKVNKSQTKAKYFETAQVHFDAWGNHVALPITNRAGTVEEIFLVNPKDVEVYEKGTSTVYKIREQGSYLNEDIIHVPNMGDSVWGKSVVKCAMEDFALQLTTREYGSTFYAKGGRPTGLLSPKHPITNIQNQQKKDAWDEAKKKGGDIVAPYGVDYTPISLPPDEAAFLASNQFGISTISRWTGVPSGKLGDKSEDKYDTFEISAIAFMQDTMHPIINKYEEEYTCKLLLDSESDLYFEFNMDAYLRADSVAKVEVQAKQIQNGIKSPDEVRQMNNDPAMGGNASKLFIQGATVPIDMAGLKPSQERLLKRYEDMFGKLEEDGE